MTNRDILNMSLSEFSFKYNYWNTLMLYGMALWPNIPKNLKRASRFSIAATYILVIISGGKRFMRHYHANQLNTTLFVDYFFQTTLAITCFICYVASISYDHLIHACLGKVKTIFYEMSQANARHRMENAYKKGVFMSMVYLVMIFGCLFGFLTSPITLPMFLNFIEHNKTHDYSLCLHIDLIISEEKYFLVYFIVAFYLVILTGMLCSLFNGFEIWTISAIISIFEFIGDNLDSIVQDLRIDQYSKVDVTEICNKLKLNINYHQKSIEIYEILNHNSKVVLFTVMTHLLFSLSISGSEVVLQMKVDTAATARMIFIFFASLFVLIFISYPSQILITASEDLRIKCYACNWYEFPPKARLLLLMMLMRTSQPCVMQAGPGIPMNYETSSKISNMAMSFVTALISLNA